ncbi:MAG: NAD(P)-dependent oxidoreductase [Caulobacteraceae bacterium]|nr:NAD(P)-dependent oxidoreductase [Caulobacteraceae bacterium]
MKKIFLTGGSGFLGRNILEKLSKKYEIYAPSRKELNLIEPHKLKSWMKDKKFDWIINCVVNGGRRTKKDTSEDFYNNIMALDNLLYYINDETKLITFSSGAEIYKQNTFYGLSKKISTNIIRGKNNIKNLRIYNLFGPYGMQDSFIYSTIQKCLKNEDIFIWEDHRFDVYSIDNLLSIINTIIKQNTNFYEEIDCVHNEKYKLSDLAKIIKGFCGSKSKIIIEKVKDIDYIGNYQDQKDFKPIKLEKTLYDLIELIKDEKL